MGEKMQYNLLGSKELGTSVLELICNVGKPRSKHFSLV